MDLTSKTHNGASSSISNKENLHHKISPKVLSRSNLTMVKSVKQNTPVKTVTAFGRRVSPESTPKSAVKRATTTQLSGVKLSASKSSERNTQAFAFHPKKAKAEPGEGNGNHGLEDVPKRREACEEMTVFVSNVPSEATEEDLRNHFMECGEVVNVTMLDQLSPCLPKRGVNIEFATQKAAEKALMMSGTWLMYTNLQVSPMEIDDESSQEFSKLVSKVACYSKKLENIQRKLYEVKHNVFCKSGSSSMHGEEEGNSSESSVHL